MYLYVYRIYYISIVFNGMVTCPLFVVLTVFGTSVYGGAMIATCLDYFLERMVMVKWVSTYDVHFAYIYE